MLALVCSVPWRVLRWRYPQHFDALRIVPDIHQAIADEKARRA